MVDDPDERHPILRFVRRSELTASFDRAQQVMEARPATVTELRRRDETVRAAPPRGFTVP